MAPIGFALISVSPMHEERVFKAVSDIPEVVEVYPLFGEYDIIAKLQADDFDSIGSVVIKKIRAIAGVLDTKTLVGTDSLKG
ncbi:MAG: Lrp/AsnC ligand binding domain-containing protein [Thermoplasmata archaeon]|nr:Lrp/AsnC ligand binding domain-containing protein [Thermoplasmata archaeon]RLF27234.1 MAG: Lrp/AsnC family transcriptional regulator [Thermoplasmata archaeon]